MKFRGDERLVIDGPFAETNELIAGFTIIQVKSKEEAARPQLMPYPLGSAADSCSPKRFGGPHAHR